MNEIIQNYDKYLRRHIITPFLHFKRRFCDIKNKRGNKNLISKNRVTPSFWSV
jgi:hypothetical protein